MKDTLKRILEPVLIDKQIRVLYLIGTFIIVSCVVLISFLGVDDLHANRIIIGIIAIWIGLIAYFLHYFTLRYTLLKDSGDEKRLSVSWMSMLDEAVETFGLELIMYTLSAAPFLGLFLYGFIGMSIPLQIPLVFIIYVIVGLPVLYVALFCRYMLVVPAKLFFVHEDKWNKNLKLHEILAASKRNRDEINMLAIHDFFTFLVTGIVLFVLNIIYKFQLEYAEANQAVIISLLLIVFVIYFVIVHLLVYSVIRAKISKHLVAAELQYSKD